MSHYNRGSRNYHNSHSGGYRGGGGSRNPHDRGDDYRYQPRRSDEDSYRRNEGNYRHRYSNQSQREHDDNGGRPYRGSSGNNNDQRYGSGRERGAGGREREQLNNSKRPAESSHPSSASAAAEAADIIRGDDSSAPQKRSKSNAAVTSSNGYDESEDEKTCKQAYVDCLRDCDKGIFGISRQAFLRPANWDERKEQAAEATIERLKEIDRNNTNGGGGGGYDGYSSSGSDDSYPPGAVFNQNKLQKGLAEKEKKFIRALPFCPPLDSGFHVLRAKGTKICYCPCGPNLEPWRKEHGVLLDREACTKDNFTPNSLMDHLKIEGGVFEEKDSGSGKKVHRPLRDIYQHATKIYLEELYKDWHGPGFGHKGLYPPQSQEHRRAEDEETRLLEREILIGRREIRRKDEEHQRLLAELKKKGKEMKMFEKLARDQQKQIKDLETMREKLHVEKKEEQKKLSEGQIEKYEKATTCSFEEMKRLFGELKDVPITVMSESGTSAFSLQQFFDDLYPKKTQARTVLFGNETEKGTNRITKLILSEWKITFDKEVTYDGDTKKDAKERKKEDTGVDEGGPSRQFLTEVFKQVDMLSVPVGKKYVKLFETTPSGAVVTTDSDLDRNISRYAQEWVEKIHNDPRTRAKEQKKLVDEAMKQAKDYSRAIGRIMLHAFSHKQTLPNNAMPPFIMNVMLHGYDDDYHHDDILKHITKIGISGENTLKWLLDDNSEERDENGNEWTKETFFRSYIPNNFIHTRKILLGSLRDGLTFGGKTDPSHKLEKGCGLSSIFSIVPMEAIRQIFFARPDIGVEDLWKVLEPKFGEGEPDPILGMDRKAMESQMKEQKDFFYGSFKKYLEESAQADDAFLAKFVECATGSNYLPYGNEFKIHIEFNFSLDPLGFPNFHSCSCEVVLPGYSAFFSDYKTFKEEKMNFAIDEVFNQFQMK